METPKNNIFRFCVYIISISFVPYSCSTTKYLVHFNTIATVSLQRADNDNLVFLDRELVKEFTVIFNDRQIFHHKKELILFAEITIRFLDGRVQRYEVNNGGNLLFDGKRTWHLKNDVISKYWNIYEENRFNLPPSPIRK